MESADLVRLCFCIVIYYFLSYSLRMVSIDYKLF